MGRYVVILVAAAGAASLFVGLATEPSEKPYFAVGPQVAMRDLDVDLPPLRVPRSAAWDRETWRIVVHCREDGVEFRSSWDPPEEDPVVRMLEGDSVGDQSLPDERPAYLLLADGDADAFGVLQTIRPLLSLGEGGRVYMAGREPDGWIGAIDVVTEPRAVDEITRLGVTVTPQDLEAGVAVRITRTADRIRYQYGWTDWRGDPGEQRATREVVLPAPATLEVGEGPLLPDLARLLAERLGASEHGGLSVVLQTGTGTRYADLLRVVECGGSDSRIVFMDPFAAQQKTIEELDLPRCRDPAANSLLAGQEYSSPRIYVSLDKSGETRMRGIRCEEGELRGHLGEILDSRPETTVQVCADREGPWTDCRWVLTAALELAPRVELAFKEKDPQIPIERQFHLRGIEDARSILRVSARTREDGSLGLPEDLPDVKGRGVRLAVPEGSRVGEVYQVILELARRGAAGFAFE
jgi:hypothetical protein